MPFPPHINAVFDAYGVPADTKAALYDLYVAMGDEVLEVFGDIAEGMGSPAELRPEDTLGVRERVVERYLRRSHPRWLEGTPTPSLWHPRALEGRASGVAIPLGSGSESARAIVGDDQPLPDGILIHGRNAHYGGRQETISFDFVARDLDDALAVALAAGQQHTMPGSVGETSGSIDAVRMLALLWEIQPNVYKPAGERNRAIAKTWRRHRNWHIATLVAAIEWLRARDFRIYVLRGEALAATHEVNREKPVTPTIVSLHNRTVATVVNGLGLSLEDATRDDEMLLLESTLMNTGLGNLVAAEGVAPALWRIG